MIKPRNGIKNNTISQAHVAPASFRSRKITMTANTRFNTNKIPSKIDEISILKAPLTNIERMNSCPLIPTHFSLPYILHDIKHIR